MLIMEIDIDLIKQKNIEKIICELIDEQKVFQDKIMQLNKENNKLKQENHLLKIKFNKIKHFITEHVFIVI